MKSRRDLWVVSDLRLKCGSDAALTAPRSMLTNTNGPSLCGDCND